MPAIMNDRKDQRDRYDKDREMLHFCAKTKQWRCGKCKTGSPIKTAKIRTTSQAPFVTKGDNKQNNENPREDAALRGPNVVENDMHIEAEIGAQVVDRGSQ